MNISQQDENQNESNNKKTTAKRSIDTKSGKSNNRRAQSADVSHDQSTSMFKKKIQYNCIFYLFNCFFLFF